ncbi:MAG: thiamine pyrophosphate-dependent enzyme, partial [archaeon]
VSEGVERARNGGGPTIVESQVYRLKGHFMGDPQVYRNEAEIEETLKQHDPVKNYREKLLSEGVITEGDLETMTGEIEEEVVDAVEYARESEMPDPSEAYEDVYSLPLYGQEGSR